LGPACQPARALALPAGPACQLARALALPAGPACQLARAFALPAGPACQLARAFALPAGPACQPARALALPARSRLSVTQAAARSPARPQDLILAVRLRSDGRRSPIPLRPRVFLKRPPVFWNLNPPSLVSRS
jgi:hypothetical protein